MSGNDRIAGGRSDDPLVGDTVDLGAKGLHASLGDASGSVDGADGGGGDRNPSSPSVIASPVGAGKMSRRDLLAGDLHADLNLLELGSGGLSRAGAGPRAPEPVPMTQAPAAPTTWRAAARRAERR